MRFVAIVLVVIFSAAGMSCSIMGESATRTQEFIADYKPGTQFDIKTRNGRVEIIADSEVDEMVITATFRAQGSSKEEAEQRLRSFGLFLEREESGIQMIHAVFPEDKNSSDACSFLIRTPGGAIGRIQNSNGKISTTGIAGPGNIDTSNGSITVIDSGAGDLKLSSSNGSVNVSGAAGRVTADTSNGSIELTLTDNAQGGFELESSNGKVVIDLPVSIGGEVGVKTSNGSMTVENQNLALSAHLKKKSGWLTLSKDGPKSTIETSNGSIKIRLR
ncbi:MAG: hypothetical protein ACI97A_003889 [Planctomycetota bacterium]|jgi:hypothetical protein